MIKALSAFPPLPVYYFTFCMQENTDVCSSLDQLELSFPATSECALTFFYCNVSQSRKYECVGYPALTNMQTGHADLLIFS